PTTGVPGPADASGAQLITDRRAGLRRQLWRSLERLVRGLNSVHGIVATGSSGYRRRANLSDLPVQDRTRCRVKRIAGWHPIRIDDGVVRHRCPRPSGRRSSDQPLVIQKRPAERRLEELISDRVLRMVVLMQVLIDGQRAGVVVALG